MPKTVCSARYTTLPVCIPPVPLRLLVTLRAVWLNVSWDIWKRYCRRVHESPVAQNCNVTATLFWNGIATRNLVSLFTVYGPTKFISNSKTVGAIGGNFLYCPLYYWDFKPAHKLVPLHTFCTTPFATSVFLVAFFFWKYDVQIRRPR
jgi:hypothetical protein